MDVVGALTKERSSRDLHLVDFARRVTNHQHSDAAQEAAGAALTIFARAFDVLRAGGARGSRLTSGLGIRSLAIVRPAVRQRGLRAGVILGGVELARRLSQQVDNDDVQLVRDCLANLLTTHDTLEGAVGVQRDAAQATAVATHLVQQLRLAADGGQVGRVLENSQVAHGYSPFLVGLRTWITNLRSS